MAKKFNHRCKEFKETETCWFGRTIDDWEIKIDEETNELCLIVSGEYGVPIKYCPFCGIELIPHRQSGVEKNNKNEGDE